MCRSMPEETPHLRGRDRLKIKSFHLRLPLAGTAADRLLPEALTLLYLGNPLEINDAKIQPGVPAFVALDRNRTAGSAEAVYASSDRVVAGDGAVRYELYVGADRVLRGRIRRGQFGGWVMHCDSDCKKKTLFSEIEVCVVGERGVVMRERVRMRRRGFCLKLEEIPEEGEMDGCDCCGCEDLVGSDGGDEEEWMEGGDDVGEMEGVRWAVDVGIWVVCLGVGLLVSRKGWRKVFP